MPKVRLEVVYEGDHCIPCVYMARLVEEVVPLFGEKVTWEKVVLRDKAGAKRFHELSVAMGRPAPIPSIFIDGELRFSITPAAEDLEAAVRECLD